MTLPIGQRTPEFVHKLRVPVRCRLAGGARLEGSLALNQRMPFREGPETVLERLNAGDRVLPLLNEDGGPTLLVNPADIEWVEPMPFHPIDRVLPETFLVTHEEPVEVEMRCGETLRGVLRFELPQELNRVSDYLNGPEEFFALFPERGVVLVNKRRVSLTRLFHQSPAPASTSDDART